MKLKTLAKQIRQLAMEHVGGFGMTLEVGERYSTLDADKDRDTGSINLEVFPDHDDTDLWETHAEWRTMECPENAELDFYVYAGREYEYELKDNLGILIRGGKIVAFRLTGDRIGASYDAWRSLIEERALFPKAHFSKEAA